VVILFAAMVSGTILIAVVGLIVGKVIHPNVDTSRGTELVAGTVQTIVGALVGFIGGRAAGRLEANGGTK
jgi:hypothetical protein